MYLHLLHELLLRLPLPVIWRLIGLNHQLQQIMINELLWKQKCHREFPVLHTSIYCYRIYWLKRTEKAYGRLWWNDCPVDFIKRAHRLYHLLDYFVLTINGELYRIDEFLHREPIYTGVLRVIEMGDLLSVVTTRGVHHIEKVSKKEGRYHVLGEVTAEDPPDRLHFYQSVAITTKMIRGHFFEKVGIALLSDGRLCEIKRNYYIVQQLLPGRYIDFNCSRPILDGWAYFSLIETDGACTEHCFNTKLGLKSLTFSCLRTMGVMKFAHEPDRLVYFVGRIRDLYHSQQRNGISIALFVNGENDCVVPTRNRIDRYHGVIDVMDGATSLVVAQRWSLGS